MKRVFSIILIILIFFAGEITGYWLKTIYDAVKAAYYWDQYLYGLEKPYREDIYGGDTPEETLQMFLDALRKGDIELAAKYIDVDHREKEYEYLKDLKNSNKFNEIVAEYSKLKKDEVLSEDLVTFATYRNGELFLLVSLERNTFTNKWKISEL